ncbi:MAG: hypothetical protein LBI61_00330 [Puniceicoccales bacterium]|nr:hypothetical protein [Puniceicoccales bacterium]
MEAEEVTFSSRRSELEDAMPSGSGIRNLIAAAVAIAAVALGMLCIAPDEVVRMRNTANVPRISIVGHDAAGERSVSAGFFLPTDRNVNCRASVPKLQCDVDAEDIGNVTVFAVGDRARIISAIDADSDARADNILMEIHLSPWQNLESIALAIKGGSFLEDAATAARYGMKRCVKFAGARSIMCIKSGDMILSSPSEFAEIAQQAGCFAEDDGRCEKLLSVGNFRKTFPMED